MPKRPSVVRRELIEDKPVQVRDLSTSAGQRFLTPCLLLFAGSGCAALIYEIVWFQLLQLVIGSSAVSLGLLLAAYMGGLCLGSLALPRFVSARLHPLRVYAALELGIGFFGIVALFGVPLVGRIYAAGAGTGLIGLIFRGAIAAVCLLPPTFLMGASLPAISRWVETSPRGVSWMGLLYSANIAGAVLGCLGAGFYVLRVHDMRVATYIAAAINAAVALVAWGLSGSDDRFFSSAFAPPVKAHDKKRSSAPLVYLVYIAIALSGLTALGAEVVWTRLLSLLLGATVYTFSIILTVFLIGLWAGSGAGSFFARRTREPRLALAVCQILLAGAITWTAFTLASVLPYWPVDPALSTNPWFNFDLDLTRCFRTIFPATFLWGASFPLALFAAAAEGEDPARLTGQVYAANTAGSIVGALIFSLVLIQSIGTRGSEQVLIWVAAAAGAVALGAVVLNDRQRVKLSYAVVALIGGVLLASTLAATVAEVPWQAIAYGRRSAPILHALDVASGETPAEPLFVGEGLNASVVISKRGEQRFFYVSGKSEASSALLDMRLQRMMGHIPALFHSAPQSVLVVGFGAGVTAGSFVPYPEVRSIVVCELEPLIPPASDQFFGKENYNVLRDSRTRVVYDDARNYIFTAPERFDIITTDPIHPWVKGTSTLYSKEYYELVKQHLNPRGVVAQWLPLYESDDETVKTELATFFSVFPKATVWGNYLNGDGYDLVLLGRAEESPIDVDQMQQRLDRPEYARVAASLADAEFHSAGDLLATYVGRGPDLVRILANATINDDLNLRLQYVAGLGLNAAAAPRIYRDLLAYRKFPEGLIIGSGERLEQLRTLFGRPHRTF
jgi:spermidine synthase